jgi:hypothetical protein
MRDGRTRSTQDGTGPSAPLPHGAVPSAQLRLLVATPRRALRFAAHIAGAEPAAVPVAPVAPRADRDPYLAPSTIEKPQTSDRPLPPPRLARRGANDDARRQAVARSTTRMPLEAQVVTGKVAWASRFSRRLPRIYTPAASDSRLDLVSAERSAHARRNQTHSQAAVREPEARTTMRA